MDLDKIKEANPIEQVIEETERLTGRGRWLRGMQHDSLVVDTRNQAYYWNSTGESGDVIAWVQARQRTDFRGAVEWLCRRGGLEPPTWSGENAQARVAARAKQDALTVACRHWVKCLRRSTAATEYAQRRGWTDETIQRAGLGYVDGDAEALRGELRMHDVDLRSSVATAILKAPKGHLIYPHVSGGRVVYFAARSIEGKEHWNPPADLVGPRQMYRNYEYSPRETMVVLVEGQADGVTLAQWGIPAIALAGVNLPPPALESLTRQLAPHDNVVLALDNDQAGSKHTPILASAFGPTTRILVWPTLDANDWLRSGATVEDARGLIESAAAFIEVAARQAGQIVGMERQAALREFFRLAARMDDFGIAHYRDRLVDALGIRIREFNALLKAATGERSATSGDDEGMQIIIEVPGGYVAEHLFEMIAVPPSQNGSGNGPMARWKTEYAVRGPDGKIRTAPFLDIDGVRFAPVRAESQMITKQVVRFPSCLGPEMSFRELVDLVRRIVHKYVDLDVFYEHIATYYVLFSWMYDSFNTLPYLRMLGDYGSGKSRFLQVVGALCYRPIFITGAATVSPIFRVLDRYGGTLVLDEGDYANSDESTDIIKILNTGYQRIQGVVLRSGDKNMGFEPEAYSVFGPKVIATRKRFSDQALESRCLTNEMGAPTTRNDIPIDLPNDFFEIESVQVRNALLRYRMRYWQPKIELDYSKLDRSVEPRLNQVTVALHTLIDDPDLSDELRNFIREYNRQMIVERGMTTAAKILEALIGLEQIGQFTSSPMKMIQIKQIAWATNVLIDTENQRNQDDEDDEDDHGKSGRKKVKPRYIGSILRKEFHLRTDRMTTGTRGYGVVWDAQRVDGLRQSYGIDDEYIQYITMTLKAGLATDGTEQEPREPPLF